MNRNQKNICLKFPKYYVESDSEYNPETDSDYNSDTEYISDCDEAILKPRKKTNCKEIFTDDILHGDILHGDILHGDILPEDINFVDKCNNLLISMVGLTMLGIFIVIIVY
jgi:hypothetical protein